jgi:hypothetical protein
MGIECSGKQGAAFYLRNSRWQQNGVWMGYPAKVEIYEPSIDLNNRPRWGMAENISQTDFIALFESTPINVQRHTTVKDGWASWYVYTASSASNGSVAYTYRGAHGKFHWESFSVVRVPSSGTFINRLVKSSTPWGSSLRSWTSSASHWFGYQTFSTGDPPVTLHHLTVTSAEGFVAYKFVKENTELNYTVHCGCEHGNCQKGTFPLKYCCFSCSDVNRWLREIRDDAEFNKHEIQKKLGLPLTFN